MASKKPAKKKVVKKRSSGARKRPGTRKKVTAKAASRTKSARKRAGAKQDRKTTSKKKAVGKKAVKKQASKKSRKTAARKPSKVRVATRSTRAARKKKPGDRVGGERPAAVPVAGVGGVPESARKRASYLNKRDLVQFRELLISKRTELVRDMGTLQDEALSKSRREAAGDLSNMPIHMADLGTDSYEQEFTLGLIEGERNLLKEIDEALARIENGTYGVCAATGKPIGKTRLRARPWAKYCYEYMLAQEKGQPGSGF